MNTFQAARVIRLAYLRRDLSGIETDPVVWGDEQWMTLMNNRTM